MSVHNSDFDSDFSLLSSDSDADCGGTTGKLWHPTTAHFPWQELPKRTDKDEDDRSDEEDFVDSGDNFQRVTHKSRSKPYNRDSTSSKKTRKSSKNDSKSSKKKRKSPPSPSRTPKVSRKSPPVLSETEESALPSPRNSG